MTTNRAPLLDAVSEALVDANTAVQGTATGTADNQTVQDALVALCRASYDALQRWEVATVVPDEEVPAPATWRTSIDDLRVQAALAEMELRDAGVPGASAADHLVRAVSTRLVAARHDVGEALASLRGELRKAVR